MKRLLSVGLLLASSVAVAQTTGPAGAPVPSAWDYVRLSPEQRYELRQKARALPPEQRTEHNRALKREVDALPTWIHEALHDERTDMDCRHNTTPPMPGPREITDGWAYVKLVPSERYELRQRALALPAAEKQAYDARTEKALSALPDWLRVALKKEADEQDRRYAGGCAAVRK
jgi:hypothetical protein